MSEGMIASVAAISAVALTLVQWMFSVIAERRQRDVQMTTWGNAVIENMAAIETACAPIASAEPYASGDFELLGERASVLVDQGRFFFPNVKERRNQADDHGTRVKLLDQVLKACYVARHMAAEPSANRQVLRRHVWESRRRFVHLLQEEMGASLRKVGADSTGDHIPSNPESWDPPTKNINLPTRCAVHAEKMREANNDASRTRMSASMSSIIAAGD